MRATPDRSRADPAGQAGGTGASGVRERLLAQRRAGRRCPAKRWIALLVLGVVVAALVVLREPLADRMWPQTRAQALRLAAEDALSRQHLTGADGDGARELFEAAMAIDPDATEASAGLARVADAALAVAARAGAQNRFADAHAHLRLARELEVPEARAAAVAEKLRGRESAYAGLDALVLRAAQARAAGRFEGGDDAALPLYRRVLALEPGRLDALQGREDALTVVLEQARAALRQGDLAGAATLVDTARRYDGGHVDLPDTLARLTEETESARRGAADALRRGRLQVAAERYRALLLLAPDDAAASRGLADVASAHAGRAERLAADFAFADAEAELATARALAPEADGVALATRHLARAVAAREQLRPRLSSRARGQRVRVLLADAQAAQARGELLEPPGESAFDKLRAARALAPDDARVQRASAQLLPAARACFDAALRNNDLGRARGCLDARTTLGDGESALAQSRRRLGQRWLAIGDERLGAGELQTASAALAHARRSDPRTPGIDAFDARLRAAQGSTD